MATKRVTYDDEKPPPSDNPKVIEAARLGWIEGTRGMPSEPQREWSAKESAEFMRTGRPPHTKRRRPAA